MKGLFQRAIDKVKTLFSTRSTNNKYAKEVERKEPLKPKMVYRKRFHGYRWWSNVYAK